MRCGVAVRKEGIDPLKELFCHGRLQRGFDGRALLKRPGALALLVGVLLLAGCGQKMAAAESASSPVPATSPTATSPMVGKGEWAAVAAASYNTLALKQNGTLWAWGLNDYGQLGQGYEDFTAHAAPRQVGHAHDWMAISGGYADSFALKRDGTLWAWGNNSDFGGNLGLGRSRVTPPAPGFVTSIDRWTPTRVGHAHDWAGVFAGYEHGLGTRKDGTLWGWGPNWYGALGVGTTDFGWSLVEVGHGADWATVCGWRRLLAGAQEVRHSVGFRLEHLRQPRPRRHRRQTRPDPGRRCPRLGGRLGRRRLRHGPQEGRHPVGLGQQRLR